MNIILIHKNNPHYLYLTLQNLNMLFPNDNLYLLGDNTNLNLSSKYNFKHFYIDEYISNFDYLHKSSNPEESEKFCIMRWIILCNFMEKEKLEHAIYFDSDVLILDNNYIRSFYDTTYDLIKDKDLVSIPYITFLSYKGIKYLSQNIKEFYKLKKEKILEIYSSICERVGLTTHIHISDMFLIGDIFDKWSRIVPEIKINLDETKINLDELKIKQVEILEKNSLSINSKKYVLYKTVHSILGKTIEYKNNNWYINDKIIPILHLQGICKKMFSPIFKNIINKTDIKLPKCIPDEIQV